MLKSRPSKLKGGKSKLNFNQDKIVLINGTSRNNSDSKRLAHELLSDVSYKEFDLMDLLVKPVQDYRSALAWPRQNDDYYHIIRTVKEADDLVLSSPIYWYGISAQLKSFIDRWSESLKTDTEFRKCMNGKRLHVVVAGGDQPVVKGTIILQQFRYICDFLGMKLTSFILGQGDLSIETLNNVESNVLVSMNNRLLSKVFRAGEK